MMMMMMSRTEDAQHKHSCTHEGVQCTEHTDADGHALRHLSLQAVPARQHSAEKQEQLTGDESSRAAAVLGWFAKHSAQLTHLKHEVIAQCAYQHADAPHAHVYALHMLLLTTPRRSTCCCSPG
jgi:hypothetical protein